jgi:hypothetical protein
MNIGRWEYVNCEYVNMNSFMHLEILELIPIYFQNFTSTQLLKNEYI